MVTARSPEGVRLSGDLFLEFWRVVQDSVNFLNIRKLPYFSKITET